MSVVKTKNSNIALSPALHKDPRLRRTYPNARGASAPSQPRKDRNPPTEETGQSSPHSTCVPMEISDDEGDGIETRTDSEPNARPQEATQTLRPPVHLLECIGDKREGQALGKGASNYQASRPESKDQIIERLHSQQALIRDWERCKVEWVDRFKQQDHKHHSQVQVLSTKVELRDKELNQLHLENRELKAQVQTSKREHRKEIDRLRLHNANQHGQLETLNQKLQTQLQEIKQELKSSQEQVVKLQDQEKGSQALEDTVNLLEAELAQLRAKQHTWDGLQTKLDNKEKALRTCMERIRVLDNQLREASKQQAASAHHLKEANEKAAAEKEHWKAQYRREEEESKKLKAKISVETASNTDACTLTPEHLQQCVEETVKLQQQLKEVCASTKHKNALLLKERQDLKRKEGEWSKEKEDLNQQLHTSQANLEKIRADLRVAVDKLEEQGRHKQLEEAARHVLVSNVAHSPAVAVQPPAKRAKPLSRQSQPKKKRRQSKAGPEPVKASSEPITLATALQLVPSPPSPKTAKLLGDLIVLSEDKEQEAIQAVLPPVLASDQTTCSALQIDEAADEVGEELLPTMMSPTGASPPKNIVEADTIPQGPSSCTIKALEHYLTKSFEKGVHKQNSQQPSSTNPTPKPAAEVRSVPWHQQPPTSDPLLAAQQFADHVVESNQVAGQPTGNGRVPNNQPARSQADLSHRISQLFVKYLSEHVAGDAPAWTALLPFCNQYGIPDRERPQLMRQLQPIASTFDVMKRTFLIQ